MKHIWISYAWVDNDDQDVDYVIQKLRAEGLKVSFDRIRLLAGERLWESIDKNISFSELDGWALYTTENSLKSEPCMEEFAYALDRVLRSQGHQFPLIGIFPNRMDRELVPSAIATRKYVNLDDPNWHKEVFDALQGTRSFDPIGKVLPFRFDVHKFKGMPVVEVWPRDGAWGRFVVGVPKGEEQLLSSIMTGPRGHITGTGMVSSFGVESKDRKLALKACIGPVNRETTGHVFLRELPSEIIFGEFSETGSTLFRLRNSELLGR